MDDAYVQLLIREAHAHLTGDPGTDCDVRLKLAHSLRVARIADRLMRPEDGFWPRLKAAGHAAAVLHDLGRFEQLKRFHTFFDARSIDHGDLSCEETDRSGILREQPSEQRIWILNAIRFHNKRSLPREWCGEQLAIARVVRDADKCDIFPILLDYLERPKNDDIVYRLEKSPRLSGRVAASLKERRSPENADFETVTDFLAAKIAWVYDLYWPEAFRIFRSRRYLERLTGHLPPAPFLKSVAAEAEAFVEERSTTFQEVS